MTDLRALKRDIHHRYIRFSISLSEARKAAGLKDDTEAIAEASVQNDAGRELLRVEKQAIRDKELNQRSHLSYVNSIRDLVHQEVHSRITEALKDDAHIFSKVLSFDERLPPLLDALSVKAASISKVEPLAANIPWLYDELIRLINSPKYRKVDARGKVVVVETLKVALTFLGFENLKMLIPAIALRRMLPQITDPYPEIKKRLWQGAIGDAKSCQKIAQLSGTDPSDAFIMGIFHDLGKIVVIRMYFRLFEEVQREAMVEAHDDKKREEHSALTEITPSDIFIVSLIEEFASSLSAKLIKMMGFKRVFIANAVEEYTQGVAVSNMSPIGKVLAQGVAYSRYRALKQHKLINIDEAKDFLRQFYFPKGALNELKTVDLNQLDIDVSD